MRGCVRLGLNVSVVLLVLGGYAADILDNLIGVSFCISLWRSYFCLVGNTGNAPWVVGIFLLSRFALSRIGMNAPSCYAAIVAMTANLVVELTPVYFPNMGIYAADMLDIPVGVISLLLLWPIRNDSEFHRTMIGTYALIGVSLVFCSALL